MAKNYNITTGIRSPRPRSKRLQGLTSGTVSSGNSALSIQTNAALAAFVAKFNEMFSLIDSNGEEVNNVDDAVAIKVKNGLALVSEGEITAFVASNNNE